LDKLLHFVEYYILGYLLYRTVVLWKGAAIGRVAPWATLGLGMIYGLSDEWHQAFVPGRDSSMYDVLSDTLGVWCAVLTFKAVRGGVTVVRVWEDQMERSLRRLSASSRGGDLNDE